MGQGESDPPRPGAARRRVKASPHAGGRSPLAYGPGMDFKWTRTAASLIDSRAMDRLQVPYGRWVAADFVSGRHLKVGAGPRAEPRADEWASSPLVLWPPFSHLKPVELNDFVRDPSRIIESGRSGRVCIPRQGGTIIPPIKPLTRGSAPWTDESFSWEPRPAPRRRLDGVSRVERRAAKPRHRPRADRAPHQHAAEWLDPAEAVRPTCHRSGWRVSPS